jgi:hypothetical protein
MLEDVARHTFGIQLTVTYTQDSNVPCPARLDLMADGFDDIVSVMSAIEESRHVTSQIG